MPDGTPVQRPVLKADGTPVQLWRAKLIELVRRLGAARAPAAAALRQLRGRAALACGRRGYPRRVRPTEPRPIVQDPPTEQLATLEAQVARLDRQQRALADNLTRAHEVFSLLAKRVDRIAAEHHRLGARIAEMEQRTSPTIGASAATPERRQWWELWKR